MILAYIAGPFTADTPWGIERNIRAAEEAAEYILTHRDDVSLIVPHSLGRCFVGRAGTPEYWYRATMRMLEASQAVVLIDGWKSSRGARAEFRRAVELGITVYATPFEFVESLGPMSQEESASVLEGLDI